MSSRRASTALDNSVPRRDNSGDEPLQIVDALDFRFVRASQCPADMVQEIVGFLDTQNTSHPFQFPQWAGKGTYLAWFRRRAELRWFAQCGAFYPAGRILRPMRGLTLNRGPVCDDLDLTEIGLRRLVEVGSRKGFAFIDIAPEWTSDFAESAGDMLGRRGWQPLSERRSSLRLDLSPDLDHLLGSFRKVARYEIRRSQRQGLEVRMACDERDCDHWLRLYLEMAHKKRFVADDSGHMRHVLGWLRSEPDRGGLLLAHKKDGTLLGGIVIVRSGARCWYVWGATSKEHKFSAGHLLHWWAIKWAKERGCQEYDFGGYREGTDSGTAFFKRGFCDNVVHFLPSHRQIISGARVRMSDLVSKFRARLRLS